MFFAAWTTAIPMTAVPATTQTEPREAHYRRLATAVEERWADGHPRSAGARQADSGHNLLVLPGEYGFARPGSRDLARTASSTVVVPEPGLGRYRLVSDFETNAVRGAGAPFPEGSGPPAEDSPWARAFSAGLSLPHAVTTDAVGSPNLSGLTVNALFDASVTYERGRSFFSGLFEIEQGALRMSRKGKEAPPVQTSSDQIRSDLLASRFVRPNVGPYVRFVLITSARASKDLFPDATTVSVSRLNGTREHRRIAANGFLETGQAWSPVLLRQGAGINARLVRSRHATLDGRAGFALRQGWFSRALFLDHDAPATDLEYREAPNFREAGVETTVVGSASYRSLFVSTDLDLFANLGGEEFNLSLDWRNTVSWRVTASLSVDLDVDFVRLPQIQPATQVAPALLLRYAFGP